MSHLASSQSVKLARRFLLNRISIAEHGFPHWAQALLRGLLLTPVSTLAQIYGGRRRPSIVFVARDGHQKASFFIEDHQNASRHLRSQGIDPAQAVVTCTSEPPINEALRRVLDRDLKIETTRGTLAAVINRYRIAPGPQNRRYQPGRGIDTPAVWASTKSGCRFTPHEAARGNDLQRMLIKKNQYVCWDVATEAQYLHHDLVAGIKNSTSRSARYGYVPKRATYLAAALALESHETAFFDIEDARRLASSLEHTRWLRENGLFPGFAETWLLGNCSFFLAGATGSWWIAAAFDRPVVVTDVYDLRAIPQGIGLFIPQLCWSRTEHRFLTFEETARLGHLAANPGVLRGELEIIKNSSDEIAEVARQMDRRLGGIEDESDDELQARFWNSIRRTGRPKIGETAIGVRIGEAFLRRHQRLV